MNIIKMSLYIIGSLSRITSNIILQLSKNNQYKKIMVLDPLPQYKYHHRFYNLQQQIENVKYQTQVQLDRALDLNDLYKCKDFDDVLYVTHDYYENCVSKTKLMELTATANRKRQHLFFATPIQYDHFGYTNPQQNYLQAEKRVLQLNPKSTIIRSDVQDRTQTLAYFNSQKKNYIEQRVFDSNFHFSPKIVNANYYAQVVCEAIAKRWQSKKIIVRGKEAKSAVYGDFDKSATAEEYTHAKDNIVKLAQKYNALHLKDYEQHTQAQ